MSFHNVQSCVHLCLLDHELTIMGSDSKAPTFKVALIQLAPKVSPSLSCHSTDLHH